MTKIEADFDPFQFDLVSRAAHRLGLTEEEWLFRIGWYCAAVDKHLSPEFVWPIVPTEPEPPFPGYRLVWHDEFDGGLTKWNVRAGGDTYGSGNLEEQASWAQQCQVEDGTLRITGDRDFDHSKPYASGFLTTKQLYGVPDSFSFTHGYVECRARLPRGGGFWPALWLVGATSTPGLPIPGNPAYGEIDVFEAYGTQPDRIEQTFHWAENRAHNKRGKAVVVGDIGEWHTYGVRWDLNGLWYYVDGEPGLAAGNTTPGINAALSYPHCINLNLAVGGNGPRKYHGWDGTWQDGDLPGVMEVDYVRVWQPT